MPKGRTGSTSATIRRGAARHVGLALAVGVGGVFALVLGGLVLRGRPGTVQPARERGEAPPDIRSVLAGDGAASGLAGGERPFVQVVDKDDPTRIRAEISADRSEPLEGKRYRLERPRAWIVMSDQRVAHVQSDSARALIPGEGGDSRPQDALLEGNVLIRLYAATGDGRWPDLATARPELTLTTTTMRFDGTLGRAEFPDALRIESREVAFSGGGVTVLFNEGAERLERLSIARTDWMVVRGRVGGDAPAGKAAADAGASGASAAADGPDSSLAQAVIEQPSESEIETRYKVVAEKDVWIVQGGREIRADRADAWLRLVGNRLRPGAIAMGGPRGRGPMSMPMPMPLAMRVASVMMAAVGADEAGGKGVAGAGPELPAVGPSDTVLRWAGGLEVVPLELAPRELARNDVYVRFVSEPESRVRFADAVSALEGDAESLEYGATRREVVMSGPVERPARARVAGSGLISTMRLEIDGTDGQARVPGPGEVVGEGARAGRITWTQDASLDFVTGASGEVRITQARAAGEVVATDGREARVRANALVAKFAEGATGAGSAEAVGGSRPELVQAIGGVVATDGKGGSLAADSVDVTMLRVERLAEDGASSVWEDAPGRLVARGNARAERAGDMISARTIDAGLSQDAEGQTEVVSLVARDEVAVATADGGSAKGDELTAWPREQRAEIRGVPAVLERTGTRIDGPFVRLEGLDRRLTVVGNGTFTHEGEAKELGGRGRAEASWTRSMTYADIDGIAVFRGEARAAWTGEAARDRAQGEEIVLQLEPRTADAGGAAPADAVDAAAPARRVLSATVRGEGAVPALVEARRYAPGRPDQLQRLLYLEGASILADNTKNTLDVPSAGRLLASDRADGGARGPEGAPGRVDLLGSRSQGDTLFTWTGSLRLTRDDGTLVLDRGVRMTHEDLGGGVTEVESERLRATFVEDAAAPSAAQAGGATPFAASLRGVTASGAAWMRSAGREMAGDSMTFEAQEQVVTVLAPPNGTVVLLDPSQGAAPVRADSLRWDLRANRVEAKGIRTIVAPR